MEYLLIGMKKKFTTTLFLSPFLFNATSCQTGSSYFVCDPEIVKHDPNGWNTCINEIANSNCPTIYLTADAAYYLLQASLVYFTSSELSRINNNTNEFADQIM